MPRSRPPARPMAAPTLAPWIGWGNRPLLKGTTHAPYAQAGNPGFARSCWQVCENPFSVIVSVTVLVPLNVNVRRDVNGGRSAKVPDDATTIVPAVGQTCAPTMVFEGRTRLVIEPVICTSIGASPKNVPERRVVEVPSRA